MTPPRGVGDATPYNVPQGFSLSQKGTAAWGQAALHPTFPQSVGRGALTPPQLRRCRPFSGYSAQKSRGSRARAPLPLVLLLTAMLLFPRQQHRQHGLFHVDAVLRLVENFVGVGFQHIGGDLLAAVGGQRVEFLAKTSATALPCRSFGSTPSLCSCLYSSATSRMCRISSGVMPPSFSRCFIRISPVRCAKSPARRPRRPPSESAAAADAGGSWRSAPADPPSRRRRGRRRP